MCINAVPHMLCTVFPIHKGFFKNNFVLLGHFSICSLDSPYQNLWIDGFGGFFFFFSYVSLMREGDP